MTLLGFEAADPRILKLRQALTEDQILDFDYRYKDKYRSEDIAKVFCYWFGFTGAHKVYLGKNKEFLLYLVALKVLVPIFQPSYRKLLDQIHKKGYSTNHMMGLQNLNLLLNAVLFF